MSIASEITRLSGVRGDIFTSITNKGVTVPVGSTFSSCPSLIDQIEGGGGGPATSMINSGFTASGYASGYIPFTATQIPVANPTYVDNSAYSGASYNKQRSYFTIFGLKNDLYVMADYYDSYQIPSYFILTMSASASGPNSQIDQLYSHFMSHSFLNDTRIFLIGNNQYSYVTTATYTSQKSGYSEYSPNQSYAPSAVYMSAIVDLSPIVNDPNLFEQATPSSTIYGDGFSISFDGSDSLVDDFPSTITRFSGSIVSSISACASVTTAYPYPTYPSATTGYITNDVSGSEKWNQIPGYEDIKYVRQSTQGGWGPNNSLIFGWSEQVNDSKLKTFSGLISKDSWASFSNTAGNIWVNSYGTNVGNYRITSSTSNSAVVNGTFTASYSTPVTSIGLNGIGPGYGATAHSISLTSKELTGVNYEPAYNTSSVKNIVYDDSPSNTSISSSDTGTLSLYNGTLKKTLQSKIANSAIDTNYSYNYGTTQTAYSGFEGV